MVETRSYEPSPFSTPHALLTSERLNGCNCFAGNFNTDKLALQNRLAPAMVSRVNDNEDALRWKRKFLDALEDQERREAQLDNRIRLLRRGLLGVSLAGDGQDPVLDRQLEELRKNLRKDDREAGLERLLEKIEASVLRLDNEKQDSYLALKHAFDESIREIQRLPIPAALQRRIRKFHRQMSARLGDAQMHQALITQFMGLLAEVSQHLLDKEAEREEAEHSTRRGLFSRLFGGESNEEAATHPPTKNPSEPALEPSSENTEDSDASEVETRARVSGNHHAKHAIQHDVSIHSVVEEIEQEKEPERVADGVVEPEVVSTGEPEFESEADIKPGSGAESAFKPEPEPEHESASEQDVEVLVEEEMVSLEGEVVRDTSGLAEPGFSYISGHVEPLLLRILECIHVSEASFTLADTVRNTVVKGLNWYDFVAVLEQILQLLRQSTLDQRGEYERFIGEVTESLVQVQQFVNQAQDHNEAVRDSEKTLTDKVSNDVKQIAEAFVDEDMDINTIRETVQAQIHSILNSMEGFRTQRAQQDDAMGQQMQMLVDRIVSLEDESRQLREHLARQEELASTDPLTELPNRESYRYRIESVIIQWQGNLAEEHVAPDAAEPTLCLAVLDVDHFKRINDNWGHLAGDKVLKIVAREMRTALKDSDFLARYGGEEFVVILPETRPADAEARLNKLRAAIEAIPFHFKEERIVVTVSCGVVAMKAGETADGLFGRADKMLYQAKQEGRNLVIRQR